MPARNEAEFEWLGTQGAVGGSLPDRRYAFFQAQGISTWREYYNLNGGTGHISDWLANLFGVSTTPSLKWTGTMRISGSNYLIGTSGGADPALSPTQIEGEDIFYLGSFGQFYWNARFGAAGTTQLVGFSAVQVSLAGTTPVLLPWNGGNQRYQATSNGVDLWAKFGPLLGSVVKFDIVAVP